MFMTVSCLIKYPTEKFTYSDMECWQLAGLYKNELEEFFYDLSEQFEKTLGPPPDRTSIRYSWIKSSSAVLLFVSFSFLN